MLLGINLNTVAPRKFSERPSYLLLSTSTQKIFAFRSLDLHSYITFFLWNPIIMPHSLGFSVCNYSNIWIYGLNFSSSLQSFTGSMLKEWTQLVYCKLEVDLKKKQKQKTFSQVCLWEIISKKISKFSPNLFLYAIEEIQNRYVCLLIRTSFLFIEYVGSSGQGVRFLNFKINVEVISWYKIFV